MESTAATTTASTTSVGLRYGLLIGLLSVLISFVSYTMQWQDSWAVRIISLAVSIGGIAFAQREFKLRNAGFMSFGQGVGVGTVAACVMGLLSAIFIYFYLSVIAPEMIAQLLEKARQGMEAKNNLSDEQIEQGMAMTAKFMKPPFMAGSTLVGSIIFGLIISLITSAFIKNAKPEFE